MSKLRKRLSISLVICMLMTMMPTVNLANEGTVDSGNEGTVDSGNEGTVDSGNEETVDLASEETVESVIAQLEEIDTLQEMQNEREFGKIQKK